MTPGDRHDSCHTSDVTLVTHITESYIKSQDALSPKSRRNEEIDMTPGDRHDSISCLWGGFGQ